MIAATPRAAVAQSSGEIAGRVLDAAGKPVSGALLTTSRPGFAARTATTDADGAWRLADLEAGTYRLTIQRLGFRVVRRDVRVEVGRVTQLSIVLELVAYTLDSLIVTGASPSIATASAELGTKLTTAEISLLPTTFDARQLIALTPGARPDYVWGGASDQANAYALDGTPVNHPGIGGAFVLPSPTWIETLEVRGLGAGAEVGGTQGGLVEIATLSGRNVVEGQLRTSLESHTFNGTNLIQGEIGRELASRRELDGQLRGPLIRDRLHFALFGNAISQEERVVDQLVSEGSSFVARSPSRRDMRWLSKLRWTPGARDVLEGGLLGRILHGERAGQTGYEASEATGRERLWNVTASLSWQRRWSPGSTVSLHVGGFVGRERVDPYAGADVPGLELLTPVNPPRYQNAPFRTLAAPSSVGAKLMWTGAGRIVGLEHEAKLGAEFNNGSWYYARTRNAGMTWRPLRVSGFDVADPNSWVFNGAIGTAWGGDVTLDSDTRAAALFAQERVDLRPWLRFTPGVRFAWWRGVLTGPAGNRFTAVREHGVEPRLGLVADVDRRGGFVFKAHWGRYHQPMFAGLFDRVAGAGGGVYSNEEIWSYVGPPPGTPTHTFTRAERDSLAGLGLFRLDETVRLDQAGPAVRYRQPYVDQLVVSVERAFGARWKAGLAYVRRPNRDMVALLDRNLAANHTVIENVMVRDRFHRQLYFGDGPLVLDRLAISNDDILFVQDLLRRGELMAPGYVYTPPNLTPAQLAALRYEPDFAFGHVPPATRWFEQLQLRVDARYRRWWGAASVTLSSLFGNLNVVTGPDDYTNGGPGPWVRLNEQYNYFGALSNQSRLEAKLALGALLPARLRGGAFLTVMSGDRFTPTFPISTLLSDLAVLVPRAADPSVVDTVSLHPFLLRSAAGHRIFVHPRGRYRYESRASLDLHLERGFARERNEILVTIDAFNVLGDRSVTAIQTQINAIASTFGSAYGRVRSRVSPRTLRLGAGVRF